MTHNHRYKTILLFGAPGSGKGTQGKILGAIPDVQRVQRANVSTVASLLSCSSVCTSRMARR